MKTFSLGIIPALLAALPAAVWADGTANEADNYTATLPTIHVEAQADTSILKGYINYDEAAVTRNNQLIKETPQSIDTLNIQKNKNYGTNDLSSILEGNAGINAAYDMRGESLFLRGFQADANDIYRDGVRESGQVRRSTANIERVEILKGPASILYGRTSGGGVINMVSKYANFKQNRNIGVTYGSWAARSANIDINQVLNDKVALRLSAEIGAANSFRSGIDSKNVMLSPSITVKLDNGLKWTGQYTYDKVERVPDRSPDRTVYESLGLSRKQGFAHPNDYVHDKLQVWRSNLEYAFNPNWQLQWQLAHRRAAQDFDHFYSGTLRPNNQVRRNYAWQQTDNKTLSSNLTLNGDFKIGSFDNHLTVGLDYSRENRNPTLGFRRTFTVDIDPYDAASWPSSGRLQPVLTRNRHQTHGHGLFVQNIFSATPNVKLVLGGRYDRYRYRTTDINEQTRSYKGSSFSPNLGVVWNVNSAHTLYAGFNKGYAPYGGMGSAGIGISTLGGNPPPEYFKQYEAGVKSDWLNQALNTTLALYQIERNNVYYQPDRNDPFTFKQRGKDRSRGIELSAIGRVAPNWYVRGSLGLMSAKTVEDAATPHNEGLHLKNTSSVTGNVFVRYTPTQNLYGEVGVTGTGKRYNYTNRGEAAHLPGFARVDALVGWNYKQLNMTLGVANLLNQKYWRSEAMPGNPRSVTARLNYSF